MFYLVDVRSTVETDQAVGSFHVLEALAYRLNYLAIFSTLDDPRKTSTRAYLSRTSQSHFIYDTGFPGPFFHFMCSRSGLVVMRELMS